MRWKGERESSNVEDQRRMGAPAKAGALGGGAIIIVIIAMLLGVNPSALLGGLGGAGNVLGGAPGSSATATRELSAKEEEATQFLRVVLGSTEDVWSKLFAGMGQRYQQPKLKSFRGAVQSACGHQSSEVGPFYCPGDSKVYIDIDFFEVMERRLGAPGDFAQAYVIAHEVGHHVQNLLGYSRRVQNLRGKVSEAEQNRWSVRLELQADFLSGVWAHHAQQMRNILEAGDIEEAMNAAAAVGDDTLQKKAGGSVRPESFTHGTAEERAKSFRLGLKTGRLELADRFFPPEGRDLSDRDLPVLFELLR